VTVTRFCAGCAGRTRVPISLEATGENSARRYPGADRQRSRAPSVSTIEQLRHGHNTWPSGGFGPGPPRTSVRDMAPAAGPSRQATYPRDPWRLGKATAMNFAERRPITAYLLLMCPVAWALAGVLFVLAYPSSSPSRWRISSGFSGRLSWSATGSVAGRRCGGSSPACCTGASGSAGTCWRSSRCRC
jgi:hypothetical protein